VLKNVEKDKKKIEWWHHEGKERRAKVPEQEKTPTILNFL
jgi:hypothetical protein